MLSQQIQRFLNSLQASRHMPIVEPKKLGKGTRQQHRLKVVIRLIMERELLVLGA